MAKKTFWVGMLVLLLVFGMTVTSCDNGGSKNFLDSINWSTAPLTPEALAASGLTQPQFEAIRNAAGGGFRGWYFNGRLMMAWTGRSETNFNSVATAIAGLPSRTEIDRSVDEYGVHFIKGCSYSLHFFPAGLEMADYFIPAWTILTYL